MGVELVTVAAVSTNSERLLVGVQSTPLTPGTILGLWQRHAAGGNQSGGSVNVLESNLIMRLRSPSQYYVKGRKQYGKGKGKRLFGEGVVKPKKKEPTIEIFIGKRNMQCFALSKCSRI